MENNLDDNKERIRVEYLMLLAIVLIFVLPYILTRPTIFGIEFNSSTGVIGDTIGGITSPIVGLLGAYLVFMGFRQQIRTNKKQFDALGDQREDSIKSSNYSQIKDLVDLSYYTLNKIVLEIDDERFVGKEVFSSFMKVNRGYNVQKFLEHLDSDSYGTNILNFSHQAVLISKYYSKKEKFKLSELGEEIIIVELKNMVYVISDIITCTNEIGKINNSFIPYIGTLERNIDRILKRLPQGLSQIELD